MKWLLDFSRQRGGGGLQVARACVEELLRQGVAVPGLDAVVARKEHLQGSAQGIEWLHVDDVAVHRVMRAQGIDGTIRYFGPVALRVPGPQIAGFAYGNLLYPEIDYYNGALGPKARAAGRWRDAVRRTGSKRLDGLIFESAVAQERAHAVLNIDASKTTFLLPSVRRELRERASAPATQRASGPPRIAVVTSIHPNKNLRLLPRIAERLKDYGCPVIFEVTIDESSHIGRELGSMADTLNVAENVRLTGSVPPTAIIDVYEGCSASLLLSRIESFSNVVLESWAVGVPLYVTRADWSDWYPSGSYIPLQLDPEAVAFQIASTIDDQGNVRRMITAGRAALATFPTELQRIHAMVAFADSIGHIR